MRKVSTLVFFTSLFLAACAHGPIGTLPKVTSAKKAAESIVIRNKNIVGATNSLIITLDGQEIFGIKIGEYTKFNLEPGKHSIGVKCFGGWTPTWKEDKKEILFNTESKYYFLISPDLWCAEIEQLTEQEGVKRVSESTYIPAQ